MVANLNRLPVKRAHHAKRHDAKRDPQLGSLTPGHLIPVRAVVAPPAPAAPAAPAPAPAAPAPAPAAPAPPVTTPAPPPVAAPAPAPAASTTTSVTPLVSAPLPVVKPVSAATSAKTGSYSVLGSPSPVPSASRLSVKSLTSSFKHSSASAMPSVSPSIGHPNSAISSSKGLSGGGIAGIFIGIIFLLFGVFLFIRRKRAIKMRKSKRNWEKDLFPAQDEVSEKLPPDGQYAFHRQSGFAAASPITPLSASYNNPSYSAPVSPSVTSSGPINSTYRSAETSGKPAAIIRCTFIPSLPDELSITTGETVTIVNEYDDGWALCANVRGEQGMVPVECLAKDAGTPRAPESDWKNAQRASSLIVRDAVRY